MLREIPLTLCLIGCSVCGFLLVYLDAPAQWVAALTYSDFMLRGGQVLLLPTEAQYWRLITPIFLHFGWLHIAFNSLWLWELGALVERRLGSLLLLSLVLMAALLSNTAQFMWSGPSLFGGMSGVVYALLGFCWIYHRCRPLAGLRIPRGIIVFMLAWLVFCMLAPTQTLGIGAIANAAHLGGLGVGCAAGGLLAALRWAAQDDKTP